MWKILAIFCLFTVANAEVYSADLKDTVEAELALIRSVYGDQMDEFSIGDFSTEDFKLKNIRMRGLNRVQVMGPCSLYINTDYLTAINQALIGVENAEFLVDEFSAPYLFYEGNQTLTNVKFSVQKFGLNIREGVHFTLPKSCDISYGLEIMSLDNTTLTSSNPEFNGKDITPFVHYTVRLALNDFLAKNVNMDMPTIENCIPFTHTPQIHNLFTKFVQ